MARHRNYRNYAYEDDMSDDVYGHSVEDYDMAVSPTTAEQFMFRRSNSRDPNLSAYMADRFGRVDEEDEEDEEDEPFNSSQDYRRPQLDPTSEAKLSSCLDQLHSILGENLHEPTAVSAVIQCNYDVERALDQIFSQEEKQDSKKTRSDPYGTEGSVSCKTQLFRNVEQGEGIQHENNVNVKSASKDDESLKFTAAQPLANVSENSFLNTFTQEDNVSQSGASSSGKSMVSYPLDLLQTSSHNTLMSAPLGSLSETLSGQSAMPWSLDLLQGSNQTSQSSAPLTTSLQSKESLSSQTLKSQPLDLLQSSTHNTLTSAPSRSLSQLGQSISSQSATSQAQDLLSAPLSSLSQPGCSLTSQSTASQPLDLLQASSQNTLLSGSLSSLPQLGGLLSLSTQPRTSDLLDLVEASSQNTLLSSPLSSLSQSGGSLSSQSSTSQSLDPFEASCQNSLLSAPLSSFSKSGESLSVQPMMSQPLDLSQASSQSIKLLIPLSSFVSSGGSLPSQPATLRPLDLLQTSSQNTLLSSPLSSLTQSEGTLSGQYPATSQSLDLLQPSHNPLLSVPLSSLSGQLTTNPQTSPVPLSLGSLSQLSCQQGKSVTGIPHSTSQSSFLQTMSSGPLLSMPLSILSQTPSATVVCGPQQEPSLSTPLSNLLQSGHFVHSSPPCTKSDNLPVERAVDDTADLKCLAEKLENVHIPGRSSTASTGEKDCKQINEAKHKHHTSGTSSTVDLLVDQKKMKSEHLSIKKQVSASNQKRQVSSRWTDTHRLTAKPTLFGLALCYSSSVENASNKTVVQRVVNELHNPDCLQMTAFNFSTPSPDDIVKEKQKGAFSRKK